jgi:hypothetical protein
MKKIFALIILLGVLIVLGYFGFIPGISDLMGSGKPRDLGVRPSVDNLNASLDKLKVLPIPPKKPGEKRVNYGQVKVNTTLTSEEITSMIQYGNYQTWPISDFQAKINPDGTGEASGMLLIDRIPTYASYGGISTTTMQKVMDTLRISSNVPFYIKGTGSISNNKVQLTPSELEIGRLPVPSSLIQKYNGNAVSFVETGINRMSPVSIKSLTAENGKIKFDGTIPAKSPHWSSSPVKPSN